MPRVKQFTVPVENRPGTLAHVAKVVGDAGINILGFLTTTSDGEGAVHLVVDDVKKAKKALESAGLAYTETDVLYVELPNKPGTLARFAGKLAAKDINITSGYQASSKGSRKATVILSVSKLEEATRVR